MEYFMENIVWFIVGAIIILMTIIGYLADKGYFSTNGKQSKEKPVKVKNKKEEEIKEDNKEEEQINMTEAKITEMPNVDDLYNSVDDANVKNDDEEISEDLYAPLNSNYNNSLEENNEIAEVTPDVIESNDADNDETEAVPEDLYAPLNQVKEETTNEEEVEVPSVIEDSAIEDKEIPSIVEENKEEDIETPNVIENDDEEVTEDLYTPLNNEQETNVEIPETIEENQFSNDKVDNNIIKENIFGEQKDIEKDKVSYDDFLTDMPIVIDDNTDTSSNNVSVNDSEVLVNDKNDDDAPAEDIWKF